MRVRLFTIALASLALSACGGGGPPSPAGLAYALPNPATVTYVTADTAFIDIDAGGQMMQMTQAASATYAASFSRAGDGVEVTLSVEDFSARLTQPMGAPITADEAGIDGPLVFSLSRQGDVTIGSLPELSGNAAQLYAPMSTAYAFFPGLPGTAVGPGDMWTDTVAYEGSEGPGDISAVFIMSYTVVGDTVADGMTLLKLGVTGSAESEVNASIQGMEMFQSVTGDMEGYVLWDTGRGLVYEYYLSMEGQGSVEVAIAPDPMSIRVRGESRTRLSGM